MVLLLMVINYTASYVVTFPIRVRDRKMAPGVCGGPGDDDIISLAKSGELTLVVDAACRIIDG